MASKRFALLPQSMQLQKHRRARPRNGDKFLLSRSRRISYTFTPTIFYGRLLPPNVFGTAHPANFSKRHQH